MLTKLNLKAHGITVCGASEYVLNYNIALERCLD
jgi:hypothetical protein